MLILEHRKNNAVSIDLEFCMPDSRTIHLSAYPHP